MWTNSVLCRACVCMGELLTALYSCRFLWCRPRIVHVHFWSWGFALCVRSLPRLDPFFCVFWLQRSRHVILPADITKAMPKGRLLSEAEWRGLGVQQSRGWEHYAIHRPEPHILLFRRDKNGNY